MTLAHHTDTPEVHSLHYSYMHGVQTEAQTLSLHRLASIFLLCDVAVVLAAGIIPVMFYDAIEPTSLDRYSSVVIVAALLFAMTAWISRTYDADQVLIWHRTIRRAVSSLLMTFFALVLIAVATKMTEGYSRVWFYSWVSLSLSSIVIIRAVLLASAEAKLAKGAYLQRALIVSCVDNPESNMQSSLELDNRVRVVGTVAARSIDTVPDLVPYIRQLKPEVIVLNLPWSQMEAANSRLQSLSQYALEVLVLPQSSACMQKAIRVRHLGRLNLLQIMEPPLAAWDREIKRAEDIIIASIALVLISPVLLLTALAIKLESKGPVLFKQMRVGFNGDLIEVWKFRSMRVEGTDLHAARQTSKNDPRVTRVGRLIRKTSIDELPQFWNVLQGQMSVVGPRPHALKTSAEGQALEAIVDEYRARHRVKPGITGWAQVNGARGELHSRDQVKRRVDYDLYYIENWSVRFDLKIVLMTIMRVLHDTRAY